MIAQDKIRKHLISEEIVSTALGRFWDDCKAMNGTEGWEVSPECAFLSTVLSPMFASVMATHPDRGEEFKEIVRQQIDLGFLITERTAKEG